MTERGTLFNKYNPAVRKEYLLLPAGFMWLAVGIMLITLAAGWLLKSPFPLPFLLAGLIAGILIYSLGFIRIARKNIIRICNLENKRCFFSFITFRSYILIIFMIALGITLRHSSIPKSWLSLVYNGIGIGLTLSSFHYFISFFRLKTTWAV